MQARLLSTALALAIGATASLTVMEPAHAVVYRGVFDPENTEWRWSGTQEFDIDATCLDGSLYAAPDYYCATLTGGTLELTNKLLNGGLGETITFDFASIFSATDRRFGFNSTIERGGVLGVSSTFLFFDNVDNFSDGSLDGIYALRWSYSLENDLVFGRQIDLFRCTDNAGSSCVSLAGPTTTFTLEREQAQALPEPASFGLAGLALIGLALTRVRRNRR